MNDSTIAFRTKERIPLGEAEPAGAPGRGARRFYGENVSRFFKAAEQVHPRHGLRDTGDTLITDIARAVAPEDKHRNVENRLSRNLQTEGLHEKIRDTIQADAVWFIDRNTLVIYDPTDVCKPHSYKTG